MGRRDTAFQASHRTKKYLRRLDFNSVFTGQDDVDAFQRTVGTFEVSRFIGRKWNTVSIARAESNDELDLDLRASISGAMRLTLGQTNQSLFSMTSGLVVNQEAYSGPGAFPVCDLEISTATIGTA